MAYEMFKVLLVDDDPIVLKLYDKLLREAHYQVTTAINGDEALHKAFQESPDIVILDIMMPRLDGYQVCARLRSAPSTANLPIMILTALEGSTARQKAHEMGADDFLTKGEAVDSMEGRIKMLIKNCILAHTRSWLAELPGNVATEYTLRGRLSEGRPVAVCYLDLNGLNDFNERAGFQEGDRVLWHLARLLLAQVKERARGEFVGYYGQDDFVVLSTPDQVSSLAQAILHTFETALQGWGGSASHGWFPALSIAAVIVERSDKSPVRQGIHPGQISRLGQVLLKEAKAEPGSAIRTGHL